MTVFKKEDKQTSTFEYEIQIYFGEKLNDDKTSDNYGDVIKSDKTKSIFVSSPAIYRDEKLETMFPNEARLKSLTYQSSIFCDIGVKYIFHKRNKSIVVKNFDRLNIGAIPVMVHSKLCLLNGLDPTKLSDFGECPYDHGGYFIIKGKEKIILSQEKKVNNIFYINENADDKVLLQGNIKSVSTSGFQSSRTNLVSLLRHNIYSTVGDVKIKRTENSIVVRVLGFDVPVPLFILFRAMGFETDKEIVSMIVYESDTEEMKNSLMNLLIPSMKNSQPIYSRQSAFKFLSLNTKGKENFNVIDILKHNLFPNYGDNLQQKGRYLAYASRSLLLTFLKERKQTDRDSYSNKRIDLAGPLLLELYRELWGNFKRQASRKIDDEYKLNYESDDVRDFSLIINEMNVNKIFQNTVMNTIVKSFGAKFGTGLSARDGVVQDLNRNVMLGTLSHTKRLLTPLPAGSKAIGPRKLHNSQFGFVCPTESPDGGNVGIINHLSVMARVTSNISEESLEKALIDSDVLLLENVSVRDYSNNTMVFLNGRLFGTHTKPQHLYYYMRLLKLNSFINITTSISWNIQKREFHVFTDSGRIIRPVFYLKRGENGKYNKLIEGNYGYNKLGNTQYMVIC